MRKSRQAIYVAAAGAALLASVLVFKRYLPYTGSPVLPKRPPSVVMTLENVYLVGLSKHGKTWSIQAKEVRLAQNRATTTLIGITHGKVFHAGKLAFLVKAGSAVFDNIGGSLALSGGVTIEANGHRLATRGAVWSSTTAALCSVGPVLFRNQWGRMSAGQLQIDIKNKQVYLWNVTGRVNLSEAETALSGGGRW